MERESDSENDTFVSLHLSAAVPPRDWIAMRHRGPRELFKLVVFVIAGRPAGFFFCLLFGAMAGDDAKWFFPDGCPCHESCSRQAWERVWKCASYVSEEPTA